MPSAWSSAILGPCRWRDRHSKPATFIAEAIGTYQLRLHYPGDVVVYAAIGLALLAVTALSTRRPVLTVLATAGIAIIGIVVYWLGLDAVAGTTFGA